MKFSFQLEGSPKKFVVSQALSHVIGITEETRAKIVSALWQYIKSNRLQDPDDRRSINLNSALKTVFG
jgi:SWI/SNF-related matrix-associated actin-dependent regulator of chromatin subfamily D